MVGIDQLEHLKDPSQDGVIHLPAFLGPEELTALQIEVSNPKKVVWRDVHDTYVNSRNLTIIQNHYTYALRTTDGNQKVFDEIPNTVESMRKITSYINSLDSSFPSLYNWYPDEVCFHKYDDPDVGLSFHKDNLRFIGMIAILSVEGECDFAIGGDEDANYYPTKPGDLMLMRAPELFEAETDIRPQHAVLNLRTPTRTSMMLRRNIRADERLSGFDFDNW
jgi:alkylated DNA repair dioxygenase AlkB